jgi:ApbE superfamily uncharacterized protein (UPF0280 family)
VQGGQAQGPGTAVNGAATRRRMDDGRWLFQHGPIDLVIDCDGDPKACDQALRQAWQRFQGVLVELVADLPRLRSPLAAVCPWEPDGAGRPVAARMVDACLPYARQYGLFITPMAAVAGSVADEIVGFFCRPGIHRAYVNNGGDIALHLGPGRHYDLGVVTNLQLPVIDGRFGIESSAAVRGIATSGWRGRSFSLGIADSVTVLAATGAAADAAATMIANRVDVDSPAVRRRPASELKDDSDLGERLVTVDVGALSAEEVASALDGGAAFAEEIRQLGLIAAAALSLRGQARVVRPGQCAAAERWRRSAPGRC